MFMISNLTKLTVDYYLKGVKHCTLDSIIRFEQPTKYIVKSTRYNDDYKTPVLTAGQTFILGYTDELENIYEASKENPVIIFDDFTGAFKWVDFPFKVKSSAMKILKEIPDKILLRYVYYQMSKISFSSNEHKRLWISIYSQFRIPIPPLDVQYEIVRILDNFSELITNLTIELTARKKQYEYYKSRIIRFDNTFPLVTLEEICLVQSGGTPSKVKSEYWNDGSIKWLGSTVCQNKKSVSEVTSYINDLGLRNSSSRIMRKETTLIALVGATIGKVAFLPFDAAINQNIAGIYPKDTQKILPSYIYYACSMLYNDFLKLSQGKLAMANISFVRGLKIPIPSTQEQARIVSIFDNFELLINDDKNGIPAEIAARQKQYEYYRDKLLTFKEVGNESI